MESSAELEGGSLGFWDVFDSHRMRILRIRGQFVEWSLDLFRSSDGDCDLVVFCCDLGFRMQVHRNFTFRAVRCVLVKMLLLDVLIL